VYAINLKNKPYFSMANGMSMVSALCLGGEVLGFIAFCAGYFSI